MQKEQHINVSCLFPGQAAIDLRIPKYMTVNQLIKQLSNIFQLEQPTKKYQLKIVNKGILLEDDNLLADYPVAHGDIITII